MVYLAEAPAQYQLLLKYDLSLQTKLEEALNLAMEFHNSLQDFINWLTQAEQTLTAASRPSLILDTVLFQIDEHKVCKETDVQCFSPTLCRYFNDVQMNPVTLALEETFNLFRIGFCSLSCYIILLSDCFFHCLPGASAA